MPQNEMNYARLLRAYEETRNRHLYEQKERRNAVYKELPALIELDRQIAEASVSAARAALDGDSAAMSNLTEHNCRISEQKNALLVSAGYPTNYLELTYTCPDCKDTGFIGTKKCHCFKQALTFALSEASTLPYRLEKENFDTFSFSYYDDRTADPQLPITPRENMKRIVADAKQFVDEFDTKPQSLLIYGNTGVGKTFLTNCIAKALLDTAHHVVYMTSHGLFETFENHRFHHTDEDDSSLYRYIFDCDLLIIDDLGTEVANAFTNSMLYTCINERLLHRKSTIISTNFSLDQLKASYSERIFSRITGDYNLWKLFGKDIRALKRMERSHS